MSMKRKILGLAAFFALFSAVQANAQSNSNLTVTATVPSVCVIDVASTDTTLAFDLSGLAAAATDFTQTANVGWRCSLNTALTLSINGGGSGDPAARVMAGPGLGLAYNLFTDNTFGTIWGDGTGGTATVADTGLGMNTVGSSTIFGRVLLADAQNAAVGNYTDTVVVTLLP